MMLSSADRPGDVAQCRDLGVAAYLTKPIAPSDLREAILRAMGHASAPSRTPRPSPSADKAARPLRVLVADDHLANRVLAAKIVQRRGHLVQAVSSGQHVLEALERETFDVVLMDVQMPEMDGFEATAAIREKEKQTGGHVPIIAMTAYAMTGDRDRCLAAGMDAYLAKPIRADELETLVESLGGGLTADGSAPVLRPNRPKRRRTSGSISASRWSGSAGMRSC